MKESFKEFTRTAARLIASTWLGTNQVLSGDLSMPGSKTHFPQVPLEVVKGTLCSQPPTKTHSTQTAADTRRNPSRDPSECVSIARTNTNATAERGEMIPRFDIFKIANDGATVWLDAVGDLHAARQRIHWLAHSSPAEFAEYFVLDQKTGEKIAMHGDGGVTDSSTISNRPGV
jgi:hypothetical protein